MASFGPSVPLLRSLSPRLSRELFTCRQCLVRTQNFATKSAFRRQFSALPFAQNTNSRANSALQSRARKLFASSLRRNVSGSAAPEAIAAQEGAAKAKSSFPDVSDKKVAYWLLASAASVFGIVVFGGLTRLTESGWDLLLHC